MPGPSDLLQARLSRRQGYAYGLAQPVVQGHVQATVPDGFPLAELDVTMQKFIREAAQDIAPDLDIAHALVWRLATWSGALQRQFGIPVSRHFRIDRAPGQDARGAQTFFVALPWFNTKATSMALGWVLDTINRFSSSTAKPRATDPDAQTQFDAFGRALRELGPTGINTASLLAAAQRLNVPCSIALPPRTYSMGTGCHTHWFDSTLAQETSVLGVRTARDKMQTAWVLRQAGLPGPVHERVTSEQQALEAASRIGYPVVVKAANLDRGNGVAAGLRNETAVRTAFRDASGLTDYIVVERHADGFTHRLTVFNGRVIRVAKRQPGGIFGDGAQTISVLVEQSQQNADFRLRASATGRITLDSEALGLLADNDLSPASIPAEGAFIRLRRRDNLSAGGTNVPLELHQVHPDNLQLAARAAALMRLNIAGVDLITTDVSRSWLDVGGVICEVNAQPQIGVRSVPEIFDAMIRHWIRVPGRIPVHLLITVSAIRIPAQPELDSLAQTLQCNAISLTSGVQVNGQVCTSPISNSFAAARIALQDPTVTAALCVMTAADLIRFGLPIDRFDSVRLTAEPKWTPQTLGERETILRMLHATTEELIET